MTASTGEPRKVLIIVENLPAPFDRRVWSEATTLKAAGYEVAIISPALPGYEAPREDIDGIRIYRHRLKPSDDTTSGYLREYLSAISGQLRLAFKVRREFGFDVIHACNPPDFVFPIAILFRILCGTRFVFDHHDLSPELYETKFETRGLLWELLRAAEWLTFRCADVSIATNESYRRIALTRGGMRPEDVFVVRSGPDVSKLAPRSPKPELKKGADHLIGYVGVIGRQEGLDLLIEAAALLESRAGRGKIHYGIVGDGPKLQAMRTLAGERGISHAFTFYGRAPDELLLDVLSTADICVNPDRATELNDKSTMNKILEYMAIGKPIVQFDLTEGRESAGGASLYAERDDAADFAAKIEQLLNQPKKRARMGAIGRERIVERLSWAHSAPRLLAAYDRVYAKARRSSAEGSKMPPIPAPEAEW